MRCDKEKKLQEQIDCLLRENAAMKFENDRLQRKLSTVDSLYEEKTTQNQQLIKHNLELLTACNKNFNEVYALQKACAKMAVALFGGDENAE